MRLALLSDIHGNLPALEAVLADAQAKGADGFAVLGDLLDRGPFPQETYALLRRVGTWFVGGNTDRGLQRFAAAPDLAGRYAPLRWTLAQLEPEALEFLGALPESLSVSPEGALPLHLLHGSPRGRAVGLDPQRDESLLTALASVEESVLACGHTHRQWSVSLGGKLALNPGSVGFSFGAGGGAQYALLSWEGVWRSELRTVPYERERTLAAFKERGLLAEGGHFARAACLSVERGEDLMETLLLHLQALLEERGAASISEVLWEEAGASFDWEAGGGPGSAT